MPDAGRPSESSIAERLLVWYDRHARRLPWRALPGETPDPYHVWLSEVMLQQTSTAAVAPYFHDFVARWPTVHDLAAAPHADVMAAWAGLGYYARARNLHTCAQVVSRDYGGAFPTTAKGLQALPGVGPYTAAAVAAIAFGEPTAPLDGNIERVVARLYDAHDPLPGAKTAFRGLMGELVPSHRPGDFAQAMMDLGATICQPTSPKCMLCPVADACAARAAGTAEALPRKAKKKPRPTRYAVAFWVARADGCVLLRRRPARGLLGGMLEVPSTDWVEGTWDAASARGYAPVAAEWTALPGVVRHGFTHLMLEVTVWAATVPAGTDVDGALWTPVDRLGAAGLPTAMRKIAEHAISRSAG